MPHPATRLAALVLIAIASALCGCATAPLPSAPPVPTSATARTNRANEVLFLALGLVGTPYRYGGNTPQGGFDCSGLVGYVFRDALGIELPRSAEELSRLEAPSVPRDGLRSGDLVFFRHGRAVSHVGIYVGEGRFVHAPNRGGTVRLDTLDAPYWRDHYAGAKRLPLCPPQVEGCE
jgi:cell wall-associated NlpC family hydrolase